MKKHIPLRVHLNFEKDSRKCLRNVAKARFSRLDNFQPKWTLWPSDYTNICLLFNQLLDKESLYV